VQLLHPRRGFTLQKSGRSSRVKELSEHAVKAESYISRLQFIYTVGLSLQACSLILFYYYYYDMANNVK